MPTTYKQTTVIRLDGCPLELMGFEAPPVAPAGLLERVELEAYPISVISEDGSETQWNIDTSIVRITAKGRTTWYPKPTIQNAVEYAWGIQDPRGSSFQFHRDGSVSAYCFGGNYFWSTDPVESEPVEGNWVYEDQWEQEDCRCDRCEGRRSDSDCSYSE